MGAAWFDYDNDGLLDLIVTNYTIWTPRRPTSAASMDRNAESIAVRRSIPALRRGSITTWATADSRM